ncbi:MAG: hypothetical protein M9962_15340 [Oligoflexia bacterium]|nr:hypothetical protein [Oligoflexia bacterium]
MQTIVSILFFLFISSFSYAQSISPYVSIDISEPNSEQSQSGYSGSNSNNQGAVVLVKFSFENKYECQKKLTTGLSSIDGKFVSYVSNGTEVNAETYCSTHFPDSTSVESTEISGKESVSASDYGRCQHDRPCRPQPGYGCMAIAHLTNNLTEKDCYKKCEDMGINIANPSTENGVCSWHRNINGEKVAEHTRSKTASCHMRITSINGGPDEGSVSTNTSREQCVGSCVRRGVFSRNGSQCKWVSAEGISEIISNP